jgi:iron(III) transport system permease protein
MQLIIVVGGALAGYYFNWLPYLLNINEDGWRYLLAAGYTLLAIIGAVGARLGRRRIVALLFLGMALYLVIYNLSPTLTDSLGRWGRTLPGVNYPKVVARLVSFIEFFTRPNLAILGFTFLALSIFAVTEMRGAWRGIVALIAVMLSGALVFFGESLTLVGTPYIIVAAYAVRSLPASVRAGVASLQQVDPSIEEASTILGGDAQYTFRKVTLPLILPAFFAGLVFAFARHMTSLSAVIFLTTAQWPILTVWILSEVEQGGMSIAAAYSVILIAIVLAAIGLMSFWLQRTYGARQDVDLTLGGG